MIRLVEIANLASLDPRNAVSVRRMPPETIDAMLDSALRGDSAETIAASLHDHRVPDGFRPQRPVSVDDATTMIRWVREARGRLRQRDRALDTQVAEQDRLLAVLGVAP